MKSAYDNPSPIEEYLRKETSEGGILGPFPAIGAPGGHINWIGACPKKHQPRKWRIITDLSAPDGFSVNDAIPIQFCSLSYITMEDVAAVTVSLHPGSFNGKNRHQVSLLPCACASSRPHLAGGTVEGKCLCRLHAPLRPTFSTQDIQHNSRRY